MGKVRDEGISRKRDINLFPLLPFPLSVTHKAKSPPKAEYENVKGEKPWKLFGRNGPLL